MVFPLVIFHPDEVFRVQSAIESFRTRIAAIEKTRRSPTVAETSISRRIPDHADIFSLEKALNAEQVKYRKTIECIADSELGELKLFNLSAKFSATPASIDAPPPRLSAHTSEILKGLGYKDDEIKAFKEKGAI